MSTPRRNYESGQHFHVLNRGHQKNVIFRDSLDRQRFLAKLDEYCDRDEITLLAYCLMDNHFHLAVRQDSNRPVSKMIGSLIAGYVQMYNRKYGAVGRLFQGPYKAIPVLDEMHMAWVTRYIHRNPEPFTDFRKYRWSSYQQYVKDRSGIATPEPVLDTFGGSKARYAIFCETTTPRRDANDQSTAADRAGAIQSP
jgi:putative transposase